MSLNYFAWIGTIYLIYLTYQDYTNNMMVDDRKNYFMLGMAVSLVSHIRTSLVYKLVLALLTVIVHIYMKKIKAIGDADINTITWIFVGIGYINAFQLFNFVIIFGITSVLYFYIGKFFNKILKKDQKKFPFYGVILINFILNMFIFRIY